MQPIKPDLTFLIKASSCGLSHHLKLQSTGEPPVCSTIDSCLNSVGYVGHDQLVITHQAHFLSNTPQLLRTWPPHCSLNFLPYNFLNKSIYYLYKGGPPQYFQGRDKKIWITKIGALHSRSIPSLEHQQRLADILKDWSVL